MQTEELMLSWVRAAVCGTPPSEAVRAATRGEALSALRELAERQDLLHLVASALGDAGLLPSDESGDPFRRALALAMFRCERSEDECRRFCAVLDRENVPYQLLKGAVLRRYYPKPWMRTSSDTDLLVRPEDVERVTEAEREANGYRMHRSTVYDVSFLASDGTHIELHHDLIDDVRLPSAAPVLRRAWETAERSGEGAAYETDPAFFVFYHFVHLAKHLVNNGCGVRPFLDLYVIERHYPYDRAACDALLREAKLAEFAEVARHLAEVLFAGAESDALTDRLKAYVWSAGIYGNARNGAAVNVKRKGKLRYLASRAFLPYRVLRMRYPILNKCPLLYPFCVVARWFSALSPRRIRRTSGEFAAVRGGENDRADRVDRLLRDLGLEENADARATEKVET